MTVELSRVKKVYNCKTVLDIDTLLLESGKIYAVLGPNGSGKSTMLRVIAGYDTEYSGSILYNGIKKADSFNIAYLPQNIYMFDYSVLKNILIGLGNNGTEGGIREKAEFALESVGMSAFSNMRAH
jgi:tungstate transport system ATP-binding protein